MDYPWSHLLPWLLHQLIILTPMAHSWTILGHPSDGPGPILGHPVLVHEPVLFHDELRKEPGKPRKPGIIHIGPEFLIQEYSRIQNF